MITQKPADLEVGLTDEDNAYRHGQRPPGPPRSRRGLWTVVIVVAVLLLLGWLISRYVSGRASAPRYVTQPVRYADISATIEESGTVNPVNEVNVGTQVSGTISNLYVDYNSPVHKGQVLATLDQTPLQAAALQAHGAAAASQASAAAAQSTAAQSAASIDNAVAAQQTAQANVAKAQAAVNLSQATVGRDRSLLSQGFISKSQLDTDMAALRANQADLNAAQSALAAAGTQIASAKYQHAANINQAAAAAAQATANQGQVQQADYNLARAVITSPIDGIVVSRAVSVGQTVAASFQTPTLFVIASSLRDMQVDTSVSEADVGQLRPGAQARITVPAYPNTVFRGTVQQVRVNPTNVQNVVTYDAIVAVHDDSARLMPGMTADVVIAVQTRKHVLAIPAAALLFRPPQSARGAGGSNGSGPQPVAPAGQGQTSQIAGAPGSRASVYVLRDGQVQRVRIVIGVSDGRNYEVRGGDLQAGDQVIVGSLQTNQYTSSNPMAGSGPGFGR